MQVIKIDKDKVLERLTVCLESIKYYEMAYRGSKKNKDVFYMKSYLRSLNRVQAELNALNWVLYQCEVKGE